MKWALSFGSAMCLALVLFPLDATAQKGAKNNNSTPATPDDYKKLATLKELTGTIVSADRSTVVLRIDIPTYAQPNNPANPPKVNLPRPNNNNNNIQQSMQRIQQDQARLQQLQAQLARTNPKQRQNIQRQIQQAQQEIQREMQQLQRAQAQAGNTGVRPLTPPKVQAPNVIMTHKDFQIDIADNAAFRKKTLGTEYDNETGNLKVYTDAEKAKLKGTDATKPGYAAKPEEMNAGAQVTLYFAPPVAGAPKKDAEGNAILPKTTVRMVYLLSEGNPQLMIQGNPKKKAK